jgi:hypothetical protein
MSYIRQICKNEGREMEAWEARLDRELDDMAYRAKRVGKSFNEVLAGDEADEGDRESKVEADDEDEKPEADDDATGGGNDHHLSRLADLVSEASDGKMDRPASLRWLIHDKAGRMFARMHKQGDDGMNREQRFEKAVRDHGVIEICKTAVEQGFVPCSEHVLTAELTKYAAEQFKLPGDRAFAKLYAEEIAVRKAIAIAKAMPIQVDFTPPMQVGGEDARAVNDPSKAVAQLQELGRSRWPDASEAQQFARAFADPANAELARKAHQRPAPTTSYEFPR